MTEAAKWLPTMHTPPLSEDFITDGDKLLEVIDLAWKSEESDKFELDEWQRWLIRAVLERYPLDHPQYPGELRYKQALISVGRQNGKSVLGAVFALYGLLLHTQGPMVVGLAYTKEQADIIYNRVKFVISQSPILAKRYKATGTRGIRSRNDAKPATYVMKSKSEESLQGITITMCLYDEVHLTKSNTWDAVLFGTSARKDAMVLGITTAGDDKSDLLKRLYKTGKAAAAGEEDSDERFGFFLWEAPDHLDVTDPEAIIAANPSYACGRLDVNDAVQQVKNMPEQQARRYRLNQFVSSEASWLPMNLWNALDKGRIPKEAKNIVYAVDRAENWAFATITANAKHNGKVYTEVVASLTNPTLESLEAMCMDLNKVLRGVWYMEASNLRDLAMRLRERGVKVEYLTSNQMNNVCATAYSMIAERRVIHANDELLRKQMTKAVSKNFGEGWRISRRDSSGEVDSVIATITGIYGAETSKAQGPMLYVGA